MLKIKKFYTAPKLQVIGKATSITKASTVGSPNDGGAPGPHLVS